MKKEFVKQLQKLMLEAADAIEELRADRAEAADAIEELRGQRDEALRLLKTLVHITLENMAPDARHPKHLCDYVRRPHIATCTVCEDWTKALAAIYPDDFNVVEESQ
jgi:hypothetical protein